MFWLYAKNGALRQLRILPLSNRPADSGRKYLAAVLSGLADVSIQPLGELTPAAWATQNR
jgi:hypothetical protein